MTRLSALPLLVAAMTLGGCVSDGPSQSVANTPLAGASASGAAPIPLAERALPATLAEHWITVSEGKTLLEGPSLDRQGNLIFTDPFGGKLLRASPDGNVTTLHDFGKDGPGGTAIHRDGRIFVAVTADHFTRGYIVALQPDGSQPEMIVPPERGLVPNDLVFDEQGGIYFTDFRGSSTEPSGGVYYVAPGGGEITTVLPDIARGNGVAMSPDGKTLWVIEYSKSRLHRIDLQAPGRPAANGTQVAYHFAGPPPDSMRVDSAGHLYVALNGQARVLVFADNGVPIAQILLPGREQGRHPATTNLAIAPDEATAYIVSGDRKGDSGANIFRARALAPGLELFSHRPVSAR
ncbi:lactonase [Kushneria avicenniae]|uniref:Lactonase n=1 Tax=Kushneria avicenniae TaxID=402385 RepID=A0A1I1N301_9GAMM|nr:SMP-30/gluconolactonase/LRE family protein [Kushneria avicenniae]SFC91795.1 lactonase [Kushneria avicenniae]